MKREGIERERERQRERRDKVERGQYQKNYFVPFFVVFVIPLTSLTRKKYGPTKF